MDDQAPAGEDGVDRGALRGVGVEDGVVGHRVGHAGQGGFGQFGIHRRVGGDRLLRLRVAGDRRDQVAVREQVARRLQVAHHGQLGVGEGADDLALVDAEARDLRVAGGLRQLARDPVGRGPVDHRVKHGAQLVQQDGVDFGVVIEREVEVVVPRAGRRDRQRAEQDRCGRLEEQLVPAREAGGQVAGLDAAFLLQFARLAVDRLHAPDGVGPDVRVGEELGEPDVPALLKALDGIRVGVGQVERPCPAVLVVQQRVAAAQIGQRVRPLPLRGGDQGKPPGLAYVNGAFVDGLGEHRLDRLWALARLAHARSSAVLRAAARAPRGVPTTRLPTAQTAAGTASCPAVRRLGIVVTS